MPPTKAVGKRQHGSSLLSVSLDAPVAAARISTMPWSRTFKRSQAEISPLSKM